MRDIRYPNESREYRQARESLLRDERELVDKVKAVAEKRRKLAVAVRLHVRPELGQPLSFV